ncbi:MAG: DNA-binding protein [Bacteroidales bacterium]|jgi:hypothetical protein|nr:DNA-binding protein [Bacteroidales bacterium]MCK9449353.1 DNA-binding protein [Bacteroidales bacterium]MDD3702495.1 DNA-binding protein [Bacteroidales bacterium]MDY0368454.1 DNA-binding protein [Bacteroidales bacterium]
MGKKKSFALRIDARLMEAVEKWAADEFRSTNGQIEWIISRALKDAKRLKSKTSSDKTSEEERNDLES